MTIKLKHDRYMLVAAGKTWALFWPRKAWAALSVEERLTLVVNQHTLFAADGRSTTVPEQPAEQQAPERP